MVTERWGLGRTITAVELGDPDERRSRLVVTLAAALLALLLATACGSARPARRAEAPATRQPTSTPTPAPQAPELLGRSVGGRRIVAVRTGDPHGPPVLVVGSMHGNETAGIAVARALERVHSSADLWIIEDLNPDGVAAGTRQNRRGVDLNANWSSQWQRGGNPWNDYYGGRRPFSEPETRIARDLILRLRPRVTIWFHQHMDVVWAWGPSSAVGRSYAGASGMRFYHHHWLPGTATNWQNHRLPGTASITVELPAGQLSPPQLRRQLRAVLKVAAR